MVTRCVYLALDRSSAHDPGPIEGRGLPQSRTGVRPGDGLSRQ
jgi:hypothetical protein